MQRRRLIRFPDSPDVQLMLSLGAASDDRWAGIYRGLKRWTYLNEVTFARFLRAKVRQDRVQIVGEAEASGHATRPLLEVMKRNTRTLSLLDPVRRAD